MHYIGMRAMRSTAMHHYNPGMVLLSIAVAVVFSWIALRIAYSVRVGRDVRDTARLAAATIMGLGIAAMHYTAMAAATFTNDNMPVDTADTVHISAIGLVSVAFTMGIVICGALITALLDRKVFRQLQHLHDQLAEERDRFHAAAECSMNALLICPAIRDASGEIVDFQLAYMNSKVDQIVKDPISHLLNTGMCETMPLARPLGLFERYRQVVLTGEPMMYEFEHIGADVSWKWIRVQAVKVRDGVAITASDITERKESEEKIHHMAIHDALTGLLNRSVLKDLLGHAIDNASRYSRMTAVLLLDLDGFKEVNDGLGHAAGDAVLVAVASRMKRVFRAADSLVRLGGDEFIVIIPEFKQLDDVIRCAEKLLEIFKEPIDFKGNPILMSASIGVGIYPAGALNGIDIVAQADTAMYVAKQRGKNQYHIFSGEKATPKTSSPNLLATADR
jgi:diguanylate cyclase (GGDEF)-like protein